MRLSPYLITEHLRNILCSYLETAYRISDSEITKDRATILRSGNAIAQSPYIETTPRFEPGNWLKDINLPTISPQVYEFASIGLPIGRFPLYKHQEEALRLAWDEDFAGPQDLIVASGTGSGKTEIFYLTILAEILREALKWDKPDQETIDSGLWSRNKWIHRRRDEKRPAAIRAIVLYPMNALVNDQLRRLRRIFDTREALEWQKRNLNGNLIYFGRYTSQTMLPGTPDNKTKRDSWNDYINNVRSGWDNLSDEFQKMGNWPRPNGSEMLSRWDMQAAPPDILLTNYSMLEYMLVRPIEASIFSSTRKWLAESNDHVLTIVLDEAHTYSGARGTEVAYLIRRLYDRLSVDASRVRCIATSASLGSTTEDLDRALSFATDLFDHPAERFSVIKAKISPLTNEIPGPTLSELDSFAAFEDEIESSKNDDDEAAAIKELVEKLGGKAAESSAIRDLFRVLDKHPRIESLRKTTNRNATELGRLATILWGGLGTRESRERATAGLLAAGAIAREDNSISSEIPPILPSRLHLMFRGLPGLWACLNQDCDEVNSTGNRICGRLYSEPRVWCQCGSRVVELLSCRTCGLLIGGGIEEKESSSHRVWPYEDDLEGGVSQYHKYSIFSLEDPGPPSRGHTEWAQTYRNIKTTAIEDHLGSNSRVVWEPQRDSNSNMAVIESPCPRCGQRQSGTGRNAIEPLRTTGSQSFGSIIEHAFRIQKGYYRKETPENPIVEQEEFDWFKPQETERSYTRPNYNPNMGRKALIFSDSRQNAARLAGDLRYSHYRDLFRQLLMLALHITEEAEYLSVPDLVEILLQNAIEKGIDPTFGEISNFWVRWDSARTDARREAQGYLDTYIRREIADRQVGVEALGLARWVIPQIDATQIPALDPFNKEQTVAILNATLRILAGENVIIPRSLDPEDWPQQLVPAYYRKVITTPANLQKGSFVWEYSSSERVRKNRLIRYLEAVFNAGNLPLQSIQEFMNRLWTDYYRKGIATPISSGNRVGFGIPITQFALSSMPMSVYICSKCKYISAETVNRVCLRCNQESDQFPIEEIENTQNNYYRKLSSFSTSSEYPDPFILRVYEHTAQISPLNASTRERRFQDQFLPQDADTPEDPVQDGVDIMSVTTTMEMGIDIGDLTVVGLHNIPPTVANYQQRAGRAGRRSDGIAEVITFARHRNHDQYYYERVAEIVTGQVRIPSLHLSNKIIAKRHLNAVVLQRFFEYLHFGSDETTLFEAFGTVGELLENNEARLNGMRRFIQDDTNSNNLRKSARSLLESSGIRLEEAVDWISELPDTLKSLTSNAPASINLLDFLIEKGALPRYAFPVDVVALWTNQPSRWNQGEEVQRDLSIALSEYAPGAEVIIDGMIHKSIGLYSPYDDSPDYGPSGWYYECPKCHYVQFADKKEFERSPEWIKCPMCENPVGMDSKYRIMPAVIPKGFRTNWLRSSDKYRGGGQERAGYSSPAQLVAGQGSESGLLKFDDRLLVFQRTGALYMVNRGPTGQEDPGFVICQKCGLNLVEDPNRPHKDPITNRDCIGGRTSTKSVLLHHFNTDIVLMGARLPRDLEINPRYPGGRATWLSVGNALRQGAAAFLQIDPEELAMGIRPWLDPNDPRLSAEIYLYDTLPNGAGYAIEVSESIEEIFNRALEIVSNCPAQCETACYRCLLEYGNQSQHAYIDRNLAKDLLRYVLSGIEPSLSEEAAIKSIKRLEPFAQNARLRIQTNNSSTIGIINDLDAKRDVLIVPVHPFRLSNRNTSQQFLPTNIHPVFISQYDMERRPFWVWDNLSPILCGQANTGFLL